MSLKLKIKKGDKVVVLSGEDKGKTGEVVKAMPNEGKVVVQGINLVKRPPKSAIRKRTEEKSASLAGPVK